MDGIAKIVNNTCLAALRPVLHALWRDKCVEIGIFLMNIGLHHPVQRSSILYVHLML